MKLVNLNESDDLGIVAPKVKNYYNPTTEKGKHGLVIEYRYRYSSDETTLQGAVWFDFLPNNEVEVDFGLYNVIRRAIGTYDDADKFIKFTLDILDSYFMSLYMNVPSTKDNVITTFLDNPNFLVDMADRNMDKALKAIKNILH